jgi:predicted PurR-regulated permease PerM
MITKFRKPTLALIVALMMTLVVTSPATASMIQSRTTLQQADYEKMRCKELDTIQRALENKLVREKLSAYGLTQDEINAKLQSMNDQQRHLLAQASEKVLSGGNGVGTVIGLLIIVLLVLIILKLYNKQIIIK